MSINQRVKKIYENLGLKQYEFSHKINISRTSLSNIIKGPSAPSFKVIESILKNYKNLNPIWLLLGEEPMWLDGNNNPIEEKSEENEEIENLNKDKMNLLMAQRITTLEREIKRTNPELADELGIE